MNVKEKMTINIEPELQAKVTELFAEPGLDISTATGLFFRQALLHRGLPFAVTLDEPNETTYAAIEAAENGEDVYGPFDSVDELMEALNA